MASQQKGKRSGIQVSEYVSSFHWRCWNHAVVSWQARYSTAKHLRWINMTRLSSKALSKNTKTRQTKHQKQERQTNKQNIRNKRDKQTKYQVLWEPTHLNSTLVLCAWPFIHPVAQFRAPQTLGHIKCHIVLSLTTDVPHRLDQNCPVCRRNIPGRGKTTLSLRSRVRSDRLPLSSSLAMWDGCRTQAVFQSQTHQKLNISDMFLDCTVPAPHAGALLSRSNMQWKQWHRYLGEHPSLLVQLPCSSQTSPQKQCFTQTAPKHARRKSCLLHTVAVFLHACTCTHSL